MNNLFMVATGIVALILFVYVWKKKAVLKKRILRG